MSSTPHGDHPKQLDPLKLAGQPMEILDTFIDGASSIYDAIRKTILYGIPHHNQYSVKGIPRSGCCYLLEDGSVSHISYAFPPLN